MFTGLIEEVGKVASRHARGGEARLRIECNMGRRRGHDARAAGAPEGRAGADDVLAVAIHPNGFEVDASAETLARTTLGSLASGSRVNLERAMPLGARMGGHLVTGHVDGTGALVKRTADGQSAILDFSFPAELARFIAEKGSICVSGISLTVNAVAPQNTFSVTIIPHTLAMTTLGDLKEGSNVNLEIDLVARYVLRAADVAATTGNDKSLEDALVRHGYKGA
jgi:riboflavin synthase